MTAEHKQFYCSGSCTVRIHPLPMERKVVTDYTNVALQNTNVKVFVRARPPDHAEVALDGMFKINEGAPGKLSIRDPGRQVGEHAFMFDRLFWVDVTQEVIFREVSLPLVERCMQGFNGCCFAYGQTGSGKTWTILYALLDKKSC